MTTHVYNAMIWAKIETGGDKHAEILESVQGILRPIHCSNQRQFAYLMHNKGYFEKYETMPRHCYFFCSDNAHAAIRATQTPFCIYKPFIDSATPRPNASARIFVDSTHIDPESHRRCRSDPRVRSAAHRYKRTQVRIRPANTDAVTNATIK